MKILGPRTKPLVTLDLTGYCCKNVLSNTTLNCFLLRMKRDRKSDLKFLETRAWDEDQHATPCQRSVIYHARVAPDLLNTLLKLKLSETSL